jgi:ferrous iron transport protein A
LPMAIKAISDMKSLEKGRIVKVGGGGAIRRRLLDMGVVAGSEVEVTRVAPLGDPVEIKVRGYDLALRKEEAAGIQVEVIYQRSEMMPLSMVNSGEAVEVAAVRAGWGLQRRLADLGLFAGVKVRVISSGRPGQVVLDVRGSRLALGHGVANKIMVVAGEGRGK